MRRQFFALGAAAASLVMVVVAAGPAGACGGLVGANGTIKLSRTTTLAAFHDGVERYVTSFEFTGQGQAVGSIVPLPGIPTKVERGGDWTLQRLEREVSPPPFDAAGGPTALTASAAPAKVILQTQVDALDITILKGGGDAVGKWAIANGFLLTPDAPAVLDFYSQRSKIFMAAKFDAAKALTLGQNSGDGTPIMLTIPTHEPWVPLRILSLGLGKAKPVNADVFVLTDHQPKFLEGTSKPKLARDEPAPAPLLSDLRSDKAMAWVPSSMWFSYLRIDEQAGKLTDDLAVSTRPGVAPSLRWAGITNPAARLAALIHA